MLGIQPLYRSRKTFLHDKFILDLYNKFLRTQEI